jgi:hypothetical protein
MTQRSGAGRKGGNGGSPIFFLPSHRFGTTELIIISTSRAILRGSYDGIRNRSISDDFRPAMNIIRDVAFV